MNDRLIVLGIAKSELQCKAKRASLELDKARARRQAVGTIQTGASKKAYQRADIGYTAKCAEYSTLQRWLDVCEEMIAEVKGE